MLRESIDDVVKAAATIDWAVSIRDPAGAELASHNADATMEIASVGKMLLLIEIARQCAAGELSGRDVLTRAPELAVADSGIWQHFCVDELPIRDLCVLVASVSDNLATNVLLNHVGLQRLRELAASLDLSRTAVLDYVRDRRGPHQPAIFATGSASELSSLMTQLQRNECISRTVSQQVLGWLSAGVDLSMVPSAFGLDPLSHATSGRELFVRNKTGSDTRVCADIGTVGRGDTWLSYAVVANWSEPVARLRSEALFRIHSIGKVLARTLESESDSR